MTEIELIEILTNMQARIEQQEEDINVLAELVQQLLERDSTSMSTNNQPNTLIG